MKPGLFSEKKLARLFVIFNNYGHIEVNVVNDNNKIVDNFTIVPSSKWKTTSVRMLSILLVVTKTYS